MIALKRSLRRALSAALGAGAMTFASVAMAGDVEVVDAKLSPAGSGRFSASVTLRHADSGWEHYADAWRLVLADGTVLGTRTLAHPHVDEQPFTRSLGAVPIAADINEVFVEARDSVHGWSAQRLSVAVPR